MAIDGSVRSCAGVRCCIATSTVAVMFLAWTAAAQAQGPVSPPQGSVQTKAQTETYWTPERMRSAIPKPPPRQSKFAGPAVFSTMGNRPRDAYPMLMPGWDPRSKKPQPTKNSLKVFLPGTQEYARLMAATQPRTFGSPPASPVDYANYAKFQRWTWYGNYAAYPTSTIGKMFFTQGGNFVCTGNIVNRNTFITAGHCLSNGAGGFSSNILICPAYFDVNPGPPVTGGPHPAIGCWSWSGTLFVTSQFHTSGNVDRDYGCVVTQPTGTVVANSVGNVVGWAGVAANFPRDQMEFSVGYPAGPPFPGYHIIFSSSVEWYSIDHVVDSGAINNVSKYIGSDQTGGSSGGGWWLSISHRAKEWPDVDGSDDTDPRAGGGPFINGVNSHARCLIACTKPPTAVQGVFWDEVGSPDFTSSGADNNDIFDVFNLCAANGGS